MKRSRDAEEEHVESLYGASGADGESPTPESIGSSRSKITEIDPSQAIDGEGAAMNCLLHSQKLTFSTYDEYEAHYNTSHLNRCLECKRNFPSARLLSVHIEDSHDPLVALKRERGERTVGGMPFISRVQSRSTLPSR